MTFIDKLKFLFTHKEEIQATETAVDKIQDAVVANGGPKSSFLSGEFYLVALPILQTLIGQMQGHLPDKTYLIITSVLAGAFTLCRTYLKK